MRWYNATDIEALQKLGSDAQVGLSGDEAKRRLEKYGANKLNEKPPTPLWKVFLGQFKDFLIYILFAAVVIAALQGQIIEAIAILIILLVNGVLGFVQEYRSEQALDALKQMAAPMAYVLRDGVQQHLLSSELVPGDIVMLEAGNTVPADGRLLETGALRIVESALTGESEAVRKSADPLQGDHDILGDQENMVFASTTVSAGRGTYVVTSTGQDTEMGKIATLLDTTEQSASPLQIELERTGKHIGMAILIIAAIIFVQGVVAGGLPLMTDGSLTFGELFGNPEFRTMLTATMLVAVALAVAAIPEGLPTIVTVTLSLGVRRMANRHAIMKRLHAVETLGSTTYICSDKTGTLTMNEMTVKRMVLGTQVIRVEGDKLGILPSAAVDDDNTKDSNANSPAKDPFSLASVQELTDAHIVNRTELETLLSIAQGCNDAHYTAAEELVGDPTETALVACVRALLPDLSQQLQEMKRVSEIPFDSDRKRMSVTLDTHEQNGKYLTFVKGGFDTIMPVCSHALIGGQIVSLDATLLQQLEAENTRFANEGLRTLAFAMRENAQLPEDDEDVRAIESKLIYVGLMASQDPPRPEVPAAVRTAQGAGIKIAMVTGDHLLTATAIAKEIGIVSEEDLADGRTHTMTGTQLEKLSDEELAEVAPDIRVYARVNPEHKIRIVSALKARGQVVAMTGDGVNDAPALKRADIGVAMGVVGTDVTREAADMVLADDNFSTIVSAVEEGRTVFANLRKVILYLMSSNSAEVMIIALIAIFGGMFAATLGNGAAVTNLLPLQILWINLMTDGFPALALGVDPAEKDVMKRRPRNVAVAILTKQRWLQILAQGLVLTIVALLATFVVAPWLGGLLRPEALPLEDAQALTRTILLMTIAFSQMFFIFIYRSGSTTVFSRETFKNKWLNLTFIFTAAMQLIVICTPPAANLFGLIPLNILEWVTILVMSLVALAAADTIGLFASKKLRDKE
ncbi:MAG: cation-translocating P-type ATPase [Coriobacteriia bacterium]|nr:cation-translocating P-type ATPase [Coriobacteriia bacterium]